jgi:hypothetical protein
MIPTSRPLRLIEFFMITAALLRHEEVGTVGMRYYALENRGGNSVPGNCMGHVGRQIADERLPP